MKIFIRVLYMVLIVSGHTAVAQNVHHNVVSVAGLEGDGWGYIVGKRGGTLYIVTPNHVVRKNDGGPDDKGTVKVRFFTDQGRAYDATVEDNFVSSGDQDLAVVTASEPPTFKYHRGSFSCLKDELPGKRVWFLGKDSEWSGSKTPGTVNSVGKDKFSVRDFNNAVEGTSGAPIFSNRGFEGMILGPTDDNKYIEALSLKFIKSQLKEWKYPYAGDDIKKSTFLFAALAGGFIYGGVALNNRRDESYEVYMLNRDATAPVYQDKSREEYYEEATRFDVGGTVSYILGGGCAVAAWLVNQRCMFHKRGGRDFNLSFGAHNGTSSLAMRWRF